MIATTLEPGTLGAEQLEWRHYLHPQADHCNPRTNSHRQYKEGCHAEGRLQCFDSCFPDAARGDDYRYAEVVALPAA